MVSPDKVQIEAERKEDENYKFRAYLKSHADEDELDSEEVCTTIWGEPLLALYNT